MKIAFVVPPALPNGQFIAAEDCCGSAGTGRLLPAGILAMANESRLAGHEVQYFDASIEPVNLTGFDAVVFTILWHYHDKTMAAMTPIIKDIPIKVAWSIPHGYAEDYAKLYPMLSFVVYSEPEMVIPSLPLSRRDYGCAWLSATAGIKWQDGGAMHGGGYNPTCIDKLRPIDYDGLVPTRYWKHYTQTAYQVTRGCPYRCIFCMWGGSTVTDRTFKMRRPEVVAEDIEKIRRLSNGKIVLYLLAAQLTTDLKWLKRFCALVEDDPWTWRSNVNLVELTNEKMDLLKRAGMVQAVAGLEALTDKTLAMINKAHTFKQAVKGIKVLEKSGIPYRLHLRCGFGETEQDVTESLANLKVLSGLMTRGQVDLGPLIYYRGTEIERDRTWPAIDHPGFDISCPMMKDLPMGWANFASEAARMKLLNKRGVKGFSLDWIREYGKCVSGWCPVTSTPRSRSRRRGRRASK